MNTHGISGNTEKCITVKETGKSRKNKLNYQQDYRIPLSNTFETLPIEESQDKPQPADEDNSILPSFNHATSKRRQKKSQLNTKNNQRLTLLMTNIKNPLNRGKHV